MQYSTAELVLRPQEQLDPYQSLWVSNQIITALNSKMAHTSLVNDTQEFKRWLDVALKITNTANRVQVTQQLLMPDEAHCVTYQNRKAVGQLVYFGHGKFARMFTFDKTGTIDRTPSLVPLSEELNKFMAIYLYRTSDHPRKYVFDSWEDASKDVKNYILRDLLQMATPDSSPWRQHILRSLFLNRIGFKFDYQEGAFQHATSLLRHVIAELHDHYIYWTKYFNARLVNKHGDQPPLVELKFPADMENFYQLAEQFCDDRYLPNPALRTAPRPFPAPRATVPPVIIQATGLPITTVPPVIIQATDVGLPINQYEICCIGIDCSPLCVVVAIKPHNKRIQCFVFLNNPATYFVPAVVMQEIKNSKSLTEEVVKLCVHKSRKCIIAVEAPLATSTTVDPKQSVYTQEIINALQQAGLMVLDTPSANKMRNRWLLKKPAVVDNMIQRIQAEIQADHPKLSKQKAGKILKYREYQRRQKADKDLPDLGSPTLSQQHTHPISDIVDATIVTYWLLAWVQCANLPNKWKHFFT